MRELLQQVLHLAQLAGDEVMRVYLAGAGAVQEKSDHSPLTEADLASHRCIMQGLAGFSDLPILSEEGGLPEWEVRRQWTRYWLIDPLDGTKEFIKRNGEFTVNIALIEQGVPVLGVVVAPALGRSYYAAQGVGAFKWQGGLESPIRTCPRAPVWRVAGSRSHGGDSLQDFLQYLGAVDFVPMGSSLKICLVAEGAADLYPRLAPTSEWDTAAAQCVLEVAGGKMLDCDLQDLRYNSKADILNPHFICAASADPAWMRFFRADAV
ncbi:3'(2'),5'-bisphosphate nucleotidase CysQ [Massilia sp. W12]|uniref:3'(2'),5'-bisphosphate nucleotidase CysQ n=1 Tax=Massilia sp. W12 TaxID=3126507 RepID=UPI0030CB308A